MQGEGEDRLAGEEMGRVWVPVLVFRNTRARDRTVPADSAVSLTVTRNGTGYWAGPEVHP